MHVLIKARVSLYENRGEFQLIAEEMEERGEGKLRRAYEALKKKLEAAGLFDPTHKKPLPAFPQQIGVITSATGAAIRDILTVLERRHPCVAIIVYPCPVQGAAAAPAIVKAIQTANRRKECEVLMLARGGGSLEDLWPFNEEIVAQAIYQSHIPIISGVGHEIDFTIADFVADLRAPTPSAAAEMVAPDCAELSQKLLRYQQTLIRHILHQLNAAKQLIAWTQKHLAQQHPKRRLLEKMQRLDFAESTLAQLQMQLLTQLQNKLNHLATKLCQQTPLSSIQLLLHQTQTNQQKLKHCITTTLNEQHRKLSHAAAKLDTLSPLATLQRGYCLAMTEDNHILRAASEVKFGDIIRIRFAKSAIQCRVQESIDN